MTMMMVMLLIVMMAILASSSNLNNDSRHSNNKHNTDKHDPIVHLPEPEIHELGPGKQSPASFSSRGRYLEARASYSPRIPYGLIKEYTLQYIITHAARTEVSKKLGPFCWKSHNKDHM